jgi:hypothetical protein
MRVDFFAAWRPGTKGSNLRHLSPVTLIVLTKLLGDTAGMDGRDRMNCPTI